jgi:IPTL-CTERM motif
MSRWVPSASRLALAVGFVLAAGRSNSQNLVLDPHFSSGTSAWTVPLGTGITVTLVRDPGPGADGAPGFATLTGNESGPINFSARTCVPVQPGVVYSFGGDVRFQSSQVSAAFFGLSFFSDAGCGNSLQQFAGFSNPAFGDTPGPWTPCLGSATAPPGAASAALVVILQGASTRERPAADIDDVFVGRAGTVGPANPIPSLSQAGLLALGVALALSGALAVRSRGR